MRGPADWNSWYAEYAASCSGAPGPKPFVPQHAAVERFEVATGEDAAWLTGALQDDQLKWYAALVAGAARGVPDVLFSPLLDAAIREIDPSFNRYFVEPCMRAFGPRRVNEYLLGVAESESDSLKAGAVNASYWAQIRLSFRGDSEDFTVEGATPESRAAFQELADIWTRWKRWRIEQFVSNANVDVRRSIIPKLDLDPAHYPDSHRGLVEQAIEIARGHEDDYIRHRVEVQLGRPGPLQPLPHRTKPSTDDGDI